VLSRRAALGGGLAAAAALGGAPGWAARPPTVGLPLTMRSRPSWGARPAAPGGRPHTITRLILHHSAGAAVGAAGAAAALRGIQAFHQNEKGWIDVAYHLFVDQDGGLWEGRDRALAGDTATTYDPAGGLLVCVLGDHERAPPAPAVGAALRALGPKLAAAFGVPAEWVLHGDLAATACPGRHLRAWWAAERAAAGPGPGGEGRALREPSVPAP